MLFNQENSYNKNWKDFWTLPFPGTDHTDQRIWWNSDMPDEFLRSMRSSKVSKGMQCKWNLFTRKMFVWIELQRIIVQLIINSGVWVESKLVFAIKQQQLPDRKLLDDFRGLRNLSVPKMCKMHFHWMLDLHQWVIAEKRQMRLSLFLIFQYF